MKYKSFSEFGNHVKNECESNFSLFKYNNFNSCVSQLCPECCKFSGISVNYIKNQLITANYNVKEILISNLNR